MNDNAATGEKINQQARAWYVRLGSEQAGADDWHDFTVWLEADPKHIDAYDRVELALLDISPQETKSGVLNNPVGKPEENPSDKIIVLQEKRRLLKPIPRSYLAGIAATFIAALALLFSANIFQSPANIQHYATNIGEYENIVLSDGTRINLNTNTKLSVQMGKKIRAVTLYSGEAYFDIAQDTKRGFIVNVKDTIITDIGTAFSVNFYESTLSVSVAHGIVDMQSPVQKVRLTKGQKAVRLSGAKTMTIASVEIDNISTWRDGVLVFENAPLSSIVPELNRYFKTSIVLMDEQTAALTFSGVLNISDQDKMINSIEALLPVRVMDDGRQILLSGKQ